MPRFAEFNAWFDRYGVMQTLLAVVLWLDAKAKNDTHTHRAAGYRQLAEHLTSAAKIGVP
jgi:hypothetical protein